MAGPLDALKKAERLTAGPKKSSVDPFDIIEFATGIPTDPDWYRNASREETFMRTVPQAAIAGLTGLLGKATRALNPPAPRQVAKPNPKFAKLQKTIRDQENYFKEQYGDIYLKEQYGDIAGEAKRPFSEHPIITELPYLDKSVIRLAIEPTRSFSGKVDPNVGVFAEAGKSLNTIAQVLSKRPIGRREFLGKGDKLRRSMALDHSENLGNKSEELYNEAWLMDDSPIERDAATQAVYDKAASLWSEAGEALSRARAPGFIDRIKAAVANAEKPVQAITSGAEAIQKAGQSSEGTRRLFFKALKDLYKAGK